jgi:hypothetical protein
MSFKFKGPIINAKHEPEFKPEKERRIKMNKFGKYLLLVTGFAILVTFARIPRAMINVHADDRVCSVASLKGTYAFHRMGVNNLAGGSNCTGFSDWAPSPRLASPSTAEMGRAAPFATPEAPAVKSDPEPINPERTEPTQSLRIVRGRTSMRTAHTATTSS